MTDDRLPDGLPTPAPPVTPETEAFWAATAEGRLLLGRCEACGETFYYPRSRCPDCLSSETSLVEARGAGTVYSYTIFRQNDGVYADAVPYVLAYVELEAGPRIVTNVVGCPVDDVEVGQAVEVVFHDTGEGSALARFTPVE